MHAIYAKWITHHQCMTAFSRLVYMDIAAPARQMWEELAPALERAGLCNAQQIWSTNESCGGPVRFATGQANTPIGELMLLPWAWLPLRNLIFCGFLLLLTCHLMRRVGPSHFMCLGSCHQSLGVLPPINSNSNPIYLEWWMIDCCRSSNCGQSPLETCPTFHVLNCGFQKSFRNSFPLVTWMLLCLSEDTITPIFQIWCRIQGMLGHWAISAGMPRQTTQGWL